MKTLATVALLALLLPIWAHAETNEGTRPPPYGPEISDSDALDIAEAVFRYQFAQNASGQQQKAPAYFLTLFRQDPSPEFLTRFSGNSPAVHKGSEFKIGKGLQFSVRDISRISPTRVQVMGGYYEGPLSSSGNLYDVEFIDGHWTVTSQKMKWIS